MVNILPYKKRIPWNKGKQFKKSVPVSEETRHKLSIASSGKNNHFYGKPGTMTGRLGKDHPKWKEDGIRRNPEINSWYKNRRNRLRKHVSGFHTYEEWDRLKAQYDWTCPCCEISEPKIKLTVDHIVPLSKGGSDNIENIQPLCRRCNCVKHTQIRRYYRGQYPTL